MVYEFKKIDLESSEGVDALVTVYGATCEQDRASELGDELADRSTYNAFVAARPSMSAMFLRNLSNHPSAHGRKLAGRIALAWLPADPDAFTEVVTTCYTDSDPSVRTAPDGYVLDMLTGELPEHVEALGLDRLAQIVEARKEYIEAHKDNQEQGSSGP